MRLRQLRFCFTHSMSGAYLNYGNFFSVLLFRSKRNDRRKFMGVHNKHRDPSAVDPRRSSHDGRAAMFSLIVVIAIAAAVFAGFYLFSSSAPTRLADSFETVPPADSSARPMPRAMQRETRPTQAPIH